MNECYTRFRINFFSFSYISKLLILKELFLKTIVQFVRVIRL